MRSRGFKVEGLILVEGVEVVEEVEGLSVWSFVALTIRMGGVENKERTNS